MQASRIHPGQAEVVAAYLRKLHGDEQVFEVRAPKTRDRPNSSFVYVTAGYYNDVDQAACDIAALDARGCTAAIYTSLNAVNPDLLARATNRLVPRISATAGDADIVARTRMLIDIDPIRPAEVSSTGEELGLALDKAQKVRLQLTRDGWPEPLVAMTGNGAALVYAVELPANDEGLVERCLRALAARHDDDHVKVDQSVHNPSRITKVIGTWARKGDNLVGVDGIPNRPHRQSRLIHAPEVLSPVDQRLLDDLAGPATLVLPLAPRTTRGSGQFASFEHTPEGVRAYLQGRGVEVKGERRKGAETYLFLATCPVNSECSSTGASDIAVVVGDDGTIGYANKHDRGAGISWVDVRDALEPGYKARSDEVRAEREEVAVLVAAVHRDVKEHPDRATDEQLGQHIESLNALAKWQYDHAAECLRGLGWSSQDLHHLDRVKRDMWAARHVDQPSKKIAVDATWERPAPLAGTQRAPAFPIADAFPDTLSVVREYVVAVAESLQVPVDLPAMLLLPVASLAIAQKAEVEPAPGWREPSALWTLTLAESGERMRVTGDGDGWLRRFGANASANADHELQVLVGTRLIVPIVVLARPRSATSTSPSHTIGSIP